MSLNDIKGKIFIHPGFVKTGTSSLQEQVFVNHPEIQYLGLPGLQASSSDLKWAIRQICYADSIIYDEERVSGIFSACLKKFDSERPVILSYEIFTLHESKDKGLVARRLKKLFPEAKLFFTLRRQEEVLASFYLQKLAKYMLENNFVPFERWLKYESKSSHLSILDDLNYFNIVHYYKKLFGREAIRLFLFEDLVKDPISYTRQIAEYIGVDFVTFQALFQESEKNLTVSQQYIDFWNFWGTLLPYRLVRKLSKRITREGGAPVKIDIGASGREAIHKLCGVGNRVLSNEFQVSLEENGYTLT